MTFADWVLVPWNLGRMKRDKNKVRTSSRRNGESLQSIQAIKKITRHASTAQRRAHLDEKIRNTEQSIAKKGSEENEVNSALIHHKTLATLFGRFGTHK
jgi:hypothetical protein